MSSFVYPASDLDMPESMLSLLGTFWANTYSGIDQVTELIRSAAEASQQGWLDLEELTQCLSRLTTPVWHTERHVLLRISESDRNGARTSVKRYGEEIYYGPDPNTGIEYNYGEAAQQPSFAYPLPSDLVSVGIVTNRIQFPSLVLIRDVDFELDLVNHAIIFRIDPFANPLFARQPSMHGDEIVDQYIDLCLFRPQLDREHIYRQFGYVLGYKAPSSEAYKSLANASMDAIVQGTAKAHIEQIMAAVVGTHLVVADGEVVQYIVNEPGAVLIITDQQVYSFDENAQPIVSVGDVLRAGQTVTDDFILYDLRRGEVPPIGSIALGPTLLRDDFDGELVFYNREEDLVVDTEHASGYTYVSWALGGHPLAVDAFWDDVHARGIAAGSTLAQLLDTRPVKVGEPGPMALPATINPVQFLVENVFRFNTMFAVLRARRSLKALASVTLSQILRPVLPPHVCLVIFFEMPLEDDPAMMNPDDEIELSIELEVLTDTASVADVDTLIVRTQAAFCQ